LKIVEVFPNEKMVQFQETTTSKSERLLANTLGYPESWHVVREVFHDGDKQSFSDTIYAGDPKSMPDVYYNHLAAMNAATKWVEGESTPYDDNGGQMLPIDQTVKIYAGDEVEVYYEPDAMWYAAVVKKVTEYKDDTRYSVKYKKDRSTQDNIFVDIIRLIKPWERKKKKTATPKGKSAAQGKGKVKVDTPKNNKRKNKAGSSGKKKQKTAKQKEEYIPDADGLHLAAEMGLPEGWTAFSTSKSRFSFLNPDGSQRFTSKKAVFDHIDSLDAKNKSKSKDPIVPENPQNIVLEGEDPPWRTDGNEYLQKRVKYEVSPGEFIFGTVTGWIAEDDVDKEGNPGFISERDGKPAALFHVSFDASAQIASQDLEKFELEELFVSDN
jgi:hypothetical protein